MNVQFTRDNAALAFDGEPFDPLGASVVSTPLAPEATASAPSRVPSTGVRGAASTGRLNQLHELRIAVTEAHRAHLDSHTNVQYALLRAARS